MDMPRSPRPDLSEAVLLEVQQFPADTAWSLGPQPFPALTRAQIGELGRSRGAEEPVATLVPCIPESGDVGPLSGLVEAARSAPVIDLGHWTAAAGMRDEGDVADRPTVEAASLAEPARSGRAAAGGAEVQISLM